MSQSKVESYRQNWLSVKTKGLASATLSFVDAYARWTLAGFPKRSPEEVEDIYKVCQSCEKFKPKEEGYGECTQCGCRLAKFPNVINKIEMKTEVCPLNRWS